MRAEAIEDDMTPERAWPVSVPVARELQMRGYAIVRIGDLINATSFLLGPPSNEIGNAIVAETVDHLKEAMTWRADA